MSSERRFRKALITGIAGSGGSYLAECILQNHPEVEVHGLFRGRGTAAVKNLHPIRERVLLYECDMNDFDSLRGVLQKVSPDVVFHLASDADVRASFQTPLPILSNNILGTANLFEALRQARLAPILLLASTSEVYGQVSSREVPVREDSPLCPVSPYAVSKAAQDLLGGVYFQSYHLPIIRTRMFTYLNPRRADLFAASFARQVARIERGLQKELLHGNLNSVRTLLDIRDAVRAYWLAAVRCRPGEIYNIGGVQAMSVGEFLELLKGHSRVPIPSRLDPGLLRPTDVTCQIPNVEKFSRETGWSPAVPLEESMQYLLSYWRNGVEAQ